MDLNLSGRRALVCGATQGIGLACARELASQGARLTLVARNAQRLAELAAELPGLDHDCIAADFSSPEELRGRVDEWLAKGNQAQILINNTGGPPGGPITQAGPDAFRLAFGMHVLCAHLLAQALLPGMKEAGWGRIINIVSTSVKQPLPGLGVSNTVRAAMAGWSKTLATEVAPFGITVNNVLPGATNTGRLEGLVRARSASTGRSEEEIRAGLLAEIPMGRFAEPAETAAAVLFLASPAAGAITGINVPVDGGRTACL